MLWEPTSGLRRRFRPTERGGLSGEGLDYCAVRERGPSESSHAGRQRRLKPLRDRRMGAELIETVDAYLRARHNTHETARRMHLTPRTVADRIRRAEDLLEVRVDCDTSACLSTALLLPRTMPAVRPAATTPGKPAALRWRSVSSVAGAGAAHQPSTVTTGTTRSCFGPSASMAMKFVSLMNSRVPSDASIRTRMVISSGPRTGSTS